MKFPVEKEAQREVKEKRTLMVGIKMDGESKEVLTWVLMKVAQAGDQIIALHVLPSATDALDYGTPSTLISLQKAFDAILDVYKGFCNLKQIHLKLRLCRGFSVRTSLIREATTVSASKLILGISKNTHGLSSSSTSVARYCSKNLFRGCLVLAVNNGKIIFQKEAAGDGSMENLFQGSDFVKQHTINKQPGKDADPPGRSFQLLRSVSKARLSCDNLNGYAAKLSSIFNALKSENSPAQEPVSKSLCTTVTSAKDQTYSKSLKGPMAAVQTDHGSPTGCVPLLVWNLPQTNPGWNLLPGVVFGLMKTSSQGNRKASFAQSDGQLPNRYSKSAVFPDNKQDKSDDKANDHLKELLSLQESYSSVCRIFSHKELMLATSNFSPGNIIGEGGSCRVYKGCLSDSKEIAVKVMVSSGDLVKDFISEIGIISSLHHKNVISLTGFCFDNNSFMFVYNFLSRGSLQDNLHGNKGGKNGLGWAERYKIAVGVAEALEYLHGSGRTPPVIHRDVKSSNILLSDDFEPQLSDFGLAQVASSSMQNTDGCDLAGTFGYLAPEYFMYGKMDEKIDVYAFGVVLLELLSGRQPICNACPKRMENLVTWAKPILGDWKLEQLIDPCLGDNYDKVEMERNCLAAFLCIRQAPGSRPSMARVVKLLHGDDETVNWANRELDASSLMSDDLDDDATFDNSNIQSHINLALLDIDEDALSTSTRSNSFDFRNSNTSLEEYLKNRWSRSSSFRID